MHLTCTPSEGWECCADLKLNQGWYSGVEVWSGGRIWLAVGWSDLVGGSGGLLWLAAVVVWTNGRIWWSVLMVWTGVEFLSDVLNGLTEEHYPNFLKAESWKT